MNNSDIDVKAAELREIMVARQIERRRINDPRVLTAFRNVPRHRFVPDTNLTTAYADHPIPIGDGQTISQPYMVALMTELLNLKGDEKVLEIGTGSGYQAAILAELAEKVYSVERLPGLAERTRRLLEEMGYGNVIINVGDGTTGWKDHAPYGGIIVTAGAPGVPQPLVDQLDEGGRLVIPAGRGYSQNLLVLEKRAGKILQSNAGGCVFVPLIGEYGWKDKE